MFLHVTSKVGALPLSSEGHEGRKGLITIGRKGNYEEWLTEDGLLQVQSWARDGLTNEQIAHNIGVNPTTFCKWVMRYPPIKEALKKGKAPVDLAVENALLKRALGYDYEEVTTEMTAGGIPRVRKYTKHMPPDTTAQIFWLKNRRPDRWRDKVEQVQTVENELLASLMALERRSSDGD